MAASPVHVSQDAPITPQVSRMLTGVSTKMPTLMAEAQSLREIQQRIGRDMDAWDGTMFITHAIPTHKELVQALDRLKHCMSATKACQSLLNMPGVRTGLENYAILRWRMDVRDLGHLLSTTGKLVLEYSERIVMLMRIRQGEKLEDLLAVAPEPDPEMWTSSEYLPPLEEPAEGHDSDAIQ